MKDLNTKYGLLKGLKMVLYDENGVLTSCELELPNEIQTNYGSLIPFYEGDGRRFKFNGLYFYKDGSLKSIDLQKQVDINTKVGIIPAEKLIFYPSGNLKRIFPLNGDISGFWTEENESELTTAIDVSLLQGSFNIKVIGLYFYDEGTLKSITLWPKEVVQVDTPVGKVICRIGVSLHPDESIHSCEPAQPKLIDTPIGKIFAYDNTAIGINGDINSLQFYEDGRLKSMVTDKNVIDIIHKDQLLKRVEPKVIRSYTDPEKKDIKPLKIEFHETYVVFVSEDRDEFLIEKYEFKIKPFVTREKICNDCENCSLCP